MRTDPISTEPRALIVEDEALIAEELRERLSRLGITVIAAVSSGEEGVEIATRERPDCARVVVNATYTPSMTAVRPDGVKLRSASRTASKSPVSGILGITA